MAIILQSALLALGVLLAGSLPWGMLVTTNQQVSIEWPWAVMLMALYLVIYWQFISGRWLPGEFAAQCLLLLRANRVPMKMWPLALVSGLLGFAALLALLSVMARLIAMPASDPITMPAAMPFATAFALLAMQSVVAGVTEEAVSGLPEWQLTVTPLPLVWQSGIDGAFIYAITLLILFTVVCAWGYRHLWRNRTSIPRA